MVIHKHSSRAELQNNEHFKNASDHKVQGQKQAFKSILGETRAGFQREENS